MNNCFRWCAVPLAAIVALSVGSIGWAQEDPTVVAPTKASGAFDVQLTPQSDGAGSALGRMTIAKTFHGDLEATSDGQMLTAMTDVQGSAGYVAIERVTGTLHRRAGSFVLQHSGTMNRGAFHLVIGVVPDSGTGELTGLAGAMTITIVDGKHFYEFQYTLAAAP